MSAAGTGPDVCTRLHRNSRGVSNHALDRHLRPRPPGACDEGYRSSAVWLRFKTTSGLAAAQWLASRQARPRQPCYSGRRIDKSRRHMDIYWSRLANFASKSE